MLVGPRGEGGGMGGGKRGGGQCPWWGEEGYQPSALESFPCPANCHALSRAQHCDGKEATGNECLCLPENAGFPCPPLAPWPCPPSPGLHFIQAQTHTPPYSPNLQRLIESSTLRIFEPIEP